MPRIVPLQLLKCLRVLLDNNGGILSAAEVKRIAGLMTKYSKKLVSKCIYVQILKASKTELLGEFMAAGGWSLVYNWLNDGIRSMNWPLVQEILELLLLCPVDVNRLKLNAAPKVVKQLCREGGNEGVRILAKRLVEQWLKIVTENTGSLLNNLVPSGVTSATKPQQILDQSVENSNFVYGKVAGLGFNSATTIENSSVHNFKNNINNNNADKPISMATNYTMTLAQRKASSQAGLVFKFIAQEGQQQLTPVENLLNDTNTTDKQTDEENSVDFMPDDSVDDDFKTDDSNDDSDKRKKSLTVDKEPSLKEEDVTDKKHKSSKDRERKSEKDRKSSSHRSSSSSRKSSTASSSSKASSSKSSSSSHRSSNDKHRSSKDKDRKDSSSSKHKSSSSSSKSTSSSSSKDKDRKDRDKDKEKSASKKDTETDKDKKLMPPPTETKKSKDDSADAPKSKSIQILSRKASISIEVRRDTEKTKTVKAYNSQFRSHGLEEQAPPPPSRKMLKKPSSSTNVNSAIIPTTLPSSGMKRASPPTTSDIVSEKKAKFETNSHLNGVIEKPGSIKLIPPRKIQTLVETNLFADALIAAAEPKKVTKRKRPLASPTTKDAPSGLSTSPTDGPKVAPLKFYQDTLDESKLDDKSATSKKHENSTDADKSESKGLENEANDAVNQNGDDDDDDIPLKKVKEDIEQRVQKEKLGNEEANDAAPSNVDDSDLQIFETKRGPGPGCGPNGPPGVLMLHRRKGPKKKLTWQTDEKLTDIRYFEIDRSERVNVSKQSFLEMRGMEYFSERDAMNMARRGFNDIQEPKTEWQTPLIEVDNVPQAPNGSQSREREIQQDRENSTLRALYFSPKMIPDSPAEAEIELHNFSDIPIIPLDDITGNLDAINDFTTSPWPEPKDFINNDIVQNLRMEPQMYNGGSPLNDNVMGGMGPNMPGTPFANFNSPNNFDGNNMPLGGPPMNMPHCGWNKANAPMMNNSVNSGAYNSPNMDMAPMGGAGGNMMGGPPQGFMVNQYVGPSQFAPGPNMGPPGPGPNGPFMAGPHNAFNGMNGPFMGAMGPNGPMIAPLMSAPNVPPMMNGNGPPPSLIRNNNNSNNNRNNGGGSGGGGWRSGGNNFQDGGGNWRSGSSGSNNRNNGNSGSNNNGVCKAFVRGHCRSGKACKYVHPQKKRL